MNANFVRTREIPSPSNGNGRSHVVKSLPIATGRVSVDGKFFRVGEDKFWVKGVTYGPFRTNSRGDCLPEPAQVERDFRQLRELGANTVRVYHAPPRWMLDQAAEFGCKIFVDTPFAKNRQFLNAKAVMKAGREAVRRDVRACQRHPAVLAYIVANEIPPDVVRWLGHTRVQEFLDELVDIAKQEDPEGLVTCASYPPTEYLHPETVDFYTMNVYLHSREKLRAYLQRLQNQADEKPLVLGEYGIDTIREGEAEQAKLLAMHVEEVFRGGLAGSCIFSFTDEWHTNDCDITDWAFGLVRRDRTPKPAFHEVAARWQDDPLPRLDRYPRVSVVVCSYNSSSTLEGCLGSLDRLNYPDYEVILVDDGSTDDTLEIALRHPSVRYHFQRNKGLSVARNVGMELATGEIIAYTDSDCFADEDWLYFLVSKLLHTASSAVGGPNLLPTDDGPVAACVAASPGSPAHILLDDELAEHIPGCNMAFWADRLRAIGGFDPTYVKAGDDVDVCWRLQAQGEKISYSPSATVWHHRRSTVTEYLKQQRGYGEAEALLKRKHPDKFRGFRAEASWFGTIYTRAGLGVSLSKPVIHFGKFATGMFQTIYAPLRLWWPLLVLSLEWWLAMCIIIGLALVFHPAIYVTKKGWQPAEAWEATLDANVWAQIRSPLLYMPILMFISTLVVSYWVAGQARPPKHQRRWWSRLLIAWMHVVQPVERAFARYRVRFQTIHIPEKLRALRRAWEARAGRLLRRRNLELWSETGVGREKLLDGLVELAKTNQWNVRVDSGWDPTDITFYGDRWCKIDLNTATDNYGGDKLLTRVRLRLKATLFYNAVVFLLGYILVLGWFAQRAFEPGGDYDIRRPWAMVLDWAHDSRWELALIPVLAVIYMRLRALWRQLNRTVVASVFHVAEELGMIVVDAPQLLARPARERSETPEPTPALAVHPEPESCPERSIMPEPIVVDQAAPVPDVAAPPVPAAVTVAPAPYDSMVASVPATPPVAPVPPVHAQV